MKFVSIFKYKYIFQTNTALEDCSGDDSIVPSTPTLFTPRRLDGETVSSPHVPSNNLIQKFTFLGESHASQLTGNYNNTVLYF